MRSTHTILVAEEKPATREFLADNLTADGYEVLVAEDRSKAIALQSTRSDPPTVSRVASTPTRR